MIRTLKVILWGEEIGRLSWDDNRKNSYFTYNPDFVKKGIRTMETTKPPIKQGNISIGQTVIHREKGNGGLGVHP